METLLVVASALITLMCVVSLYAFIGVRSLQNRLGHIDEEFADTYRANENLERDLTNEIDHCQKSREDDVHEIHRRIDEVYREIDLLQQKFDSELDKRFDKCYRTQYEFRDWSKEQIERLIEKDLENRK